MPIYSHSRLGAFETCPRKYWFAYIGKPEIETADTVEAFLGTRAHEALEELYRRQIGGQLMTMPDLLAWYEDQWRKQWHAGVQVTDTTFTAADYRKVGHESLKAYYKRYQPFEADKTLRLEMQVLLNLDGEGKYKLQGYVDRLSQRADGAYEIHDYKTSRRIPTQAEADQDRQLALYQMGVQAAWPDAGAVDLVWHYLRFDKEVRSRRTEEQLAEVRRSCIATIDDIEARGKAEDSFPTAKSNLCGWCEYRSLCPATRHFAAVEALPPKKFKADDGVSMVNAWVALRDKRQELQDADATLAAQEEAIQSQLVEFARQKKVESVAGSSHHVDIVQRTGIEYPKADDDRREAFEKALRKAGLWDDVTVVNWASLLAAWKGSDLPAGARKLLKPFVREVTETQAKLRKGGAEEMDA